MEGIPRPSRVGGVVIQIGVGDEVGTVRGVFVVVEGEESLAWEGFFPCVAFVA